MGRTRYSIRFLFFYRVTSCQSFGSLDRTPLAVVIWSRRMAGNIIEMIMINTFRVHTIYYHTHGTLCSPHNALAVAHDSGLNPQGHTPQVY